MPTIRPEPGRPKRDSSRGLAGPLLLVPGLPQWLWGRRDQSLLYAGMFAASIGMALFVWGTRTSLLMLACAYGTHIASVSDAIRQRSFPEFGRWVPAIAASAGLGLGCYAPLLVAGSLFAWPGLLDDGLREGYLVNRFAFNKSQSPKRGNDIWLRGEGNRGSSRLARVVAEPGMDVEWANDRLRVAGKPVEFQPYRSGRAPKSLTFRIPPDRILIAFQTEDPLRSDVWEIVSMDRVEGRAWAKLYPVWERRLL